MMESRRTAGAPPVESLWVTAALNPVQINTIQVYKRSRRTQTRDGCALVLHYFDMTANIYCENHDHVGLKKDLFLISFKTLRSDWLVVLGAFGQEH